MQGTLRFASDTKQKLTEFRSIDLLTGKLDSKDQAGQAKRHTKKRKKAKVLKMTQVLQEKLWKQPPGTSDHIPASLSLCQGMPVMIRYNTATELCVTKGQEAVVVGWDSTPGPFDSEVLETLFVQLINPPTRVRIPGLPHNVVPLNRQKQSVPCRLPDDSVIVVDRDQVHVLPNFAMTDYASQGKTRAYNVVELSESKNFQAIYTALSRSSTAAHTYILGDLNKRQIDKVSQGLTKLHISEGMRNPLIKAFVDRCKGEGINFTQDWHPAIQLNNILDLVAKPANDQASSLWDSKVAREVFKEGQDRLAKRSPLTSEGGKEDKKQRKV
ncbi:hypothetical protein FA13DRAFT_1640071, partial [Coprinellus micaceus]